jgi:hypothetical protein
MPESDQYVEWKTWDELDAPGNLTWSGQHNEGFERGNNHQFSLSLGNVPEGSPLNFTKQCPSSHQVSLQKPTNLMSMEKTLDQQFDFPITRFRVCLRLIILRLLPGQFSFPQGFRSNASLEQERRRRFHLLKPASESGHVDVTTQSLGKLSPAMNDALPGTTTKNRYVAAKAPVSIRVNSESVSNEIDESDSQYEKQSEQMI